MSPIPDPGPDPAPAACNGPMNIFEHLKQAGGVARTAQLLKAGYSRRDIGQLTDRGATQPRRGIFLAPDWDLDLAAAIQHGGRRTWPGNKPGRNARTWCKQEGSYRLAAGTSTQRTSTGLSVGLTQVCGSRPGKVTVSPVLSSYCSLVRMSRMLPLMTCSTSTSQSTA